MFEIEGFIEECRAAMATGHGTRDVRDVVARAVAEPEAVSRALGAPANGVRTLLRSPELTVLEIVWAPKMVIMPHNHDMWAVIGVFDGREDNILWRRLPEDAGQRVEAAGAKTLGTGDTIAMGRDVVHSVLNPLGRPTRALHVYGGDFFAAQRSEWDPETLTERPYDMERVMRMLSAG